MSCLTRSHFRGHLIIPRILCMSLTPLCPPVHSSRSRAAGRRVRLEAGDNQGHRVHGGAGVPGGPRRRRGQAAPGACVYLRLSAIVVSVKLPRLRLQRDALDCTERENPTAIPPVCWGGFTAAIDRRRTRSTTTAAAAGVIRLRTTVERGNTTTSGAGSCFPCPPSRRRSTPPQAAAGTLPSSAFRTRWQPRRVRAGSVVVVQLVIAHSFFVTQFDDCGCWVLLSIFFLIFIPFRHDAQVSRGWRRKL